MTWSKAYLETRVLSAGPVDLVVMSYEFASLRVHEARTALAKGDIAARCTAISKALAILAELEASLDYRQGGAIADNLSRLYPYMRDRLVQANLRQEDGPLAETESLLETLAEGWREVRNASESDGETVGAGEVQGRWSAFALADSGADHRAQGWSA